MESNDQLIKVPFVKNLIDTEDLEKVQSKYKENKYKKFKRPFDLNEALNHGKAIRVCKNNRQLLSQKAIKDQNLDKCPCCGYIIENEQLPLNCELEDFLHLGTTYPLYFYYIKYCILLLIIQFVISSIPALILNRNGSTCEAESQNNFICQLSFLNILDKRQHPTQRFQIVFNTIFLVLSFVIIALFLQDSKKKQKEYTQEQILISDFSIYMANLPEKATSDQIKIFFEKKIQEEVQIQKIYFLYDLNFYGKIYEQYKNLMLSNKQDSKIYKQIQNLRQQLINLEQQYNNSVSKASDDKLKFSGKAIITFNSIQQATQIKKAFKISKRERFFVYFKSFFSQKAKQVMEKYCLEGQLIKINKAPEPSDIQWYNIGQKKKRKRNVVISYIIVYLVMLITFAVLLFLKKQIKDTQKQQTQIVSLLLSFTVSTIVCIFNSLIGIVIRKGSGYEKHEVQTSFFVSVGKKLTNMFLLNMVLSTFMSNIVHYYVFNKNKAFPLDTQGLMNDFFFLFITNSYMGSIFNIFDIVWGYRLFRRKQAIKNKEKITQQEANQLFEGHPIDMALRYANINKTIFFTAAVSPFIPLGVPLSVIGIIISYWVDKYLLITRYVCKNYLSFQLAKKMVSGLRMYSVYFAIGNFISMLMPVMDHDINISFKWGNAQQSVFFYLIIVGVWTAIFVRYLPFFNYFIKFIFRKFFFKQRDGIINEKKSLIYTNISYKCNDDYDRYQPINNLQVNQETQSNNSSVKAVKNDTFIRQNLQQIFLSIQNQIDCK